MTRSRRETASRFNQARLLERRLFATCFLGQPAARVADTLRGYQNDDGGFGHALEPDKRCPASLPIDVETAFQVLATAGTVDHDMVVRACNFLARAAEEAGAGGAVPLAFPVIESFPRAASWTEWTYEPGLNPTAGLVGLLYQLCIDHPWRSAGAAYCWQQIESGGLPGDAHALKEVLVFLEHAPDRHRADQHAAALASNLASIPLFHLDPDAPGYGLSPLDVAPQATSRWRTLFTDAQIDAHLDRLQKEPAGRRRVAHHLGAPPPGRGSRMAGGRDPASPAHAHLLRAAHREQVRPSRQVGTSGADGRRHGQLPTPSPGDPSAA